MVTTRFCSAHNVLAFFFKLKSTTKADWHLNPSLPSQGSPARGHSKSPSFWVQGNLERVFKCVAESCMRLHKERCYRDRPFKRLHIISSGTFTLSKRYSCRRVPRDMGGIS